MDARPATTNVSKPSSGTRRSNGCRHRGDRRSPAARGESPRVVRLTRQIVDLHATELLQLGQHRVALHRATGVVRYESRKRWALKKGRRKKAADVPSLVMELSAEDDLGRSSKSPTSRAAPTHPAHPAEQAQHRPSPSLHWARATGTALTATSSSALVISSVSLATALVGATAVSTTIVAALIGGDAPGGVGDAIRRATTT